jgi:hypothetical protein
MIMIEKAQRYDRNCKMVEKYENVDLGYRARDLVRGETMLKSSRISTGCPQMPRMDASSTWC